MLRTNFIISQFLFCAIRKKPDGALLVARNLYAASALGIDGYISSREKVKLHFLNNVDNYRKKMNEFVTNKPTSMVFTEDLKNMVHIAEKTQEDVDLVINMMKKFNSQGKDLRFGNYVFGPVVLRMFHFFQDVESALKCFNDPELDGFFDQLVSFQLLMDMLYKKGQYKDMLDIFNTVKSRQIQSGKYPKHAVVLAFAACFKMNTQDSFDYAMKLWQELNDTGHVPMRKATTFAAGLALQQNAPHIALEIISTLKDQHYLTVRNIKALAYADLGRPEDALPVLRSVLEIDDSLNKKQTFIKNAIDKVRESIKKNNKIELESDFKRIATFLSDHGNISDQSLEDILCTEIASTAYSTQRKERSFIAESFVRQNRNISSRNRQIERRGLRDIY